MQTGILQDTSFLVEMSSRDIKIFNTENMERPHG